MTKHFHRDLEDIKKEILVLGAMVEEALSKATTALTERRPDLAAGVVDEDAQIDGMEVRVEEECLKVLALHQPVALDLRFVVMVIKVNSDLERIGDHAADIAQRAIALGAEPAIPLIPAFPAMVHKVRDMVRDCLDALVNVDTDVARRICADDDVVDGHLREMFAYLEGLMKREPATIERAISTLSACRHLERVADLATNIAEDVLFMAEGEIVRHRMAEPDQT